MAQKLKLIELFIKYLIAVPFLGEGAPILVILIDPEFMKISARDDRPRQHYAYFRWLCVRFVYCTMWCYNMQKTEVQQ